MGSVYLLVVLLLVIEQIIDSELKTKKTFIIRVAKPVSIFRRHKYNVCFMEEETNFHFFVQMA